MGREAADIEWNVFAVTDVGRVRRNNEDSFVVADLSTGDAQRTPVEGRYRQGRLGLLLLVADGMGGEASGEVASEICVTVVPARLRELLRSADPLHEAAFLEALHNALADANRAIFLKAQESPLFAGMGTTATAAGVFGARLFVGQVGDSRAYLHRGKRLVQLTRDQTFLNYLADIGAQLPADPESDGRRNILTQAVGTSPLLDVKVSQIDLCRGDRILVCSDGLYSMVRQPEIEALLAQPGSLDEVGHNLVSAANANGGKDNVTVILAEASGAGLPEPDGDPQPKELESSGGPSPSGRHRA